MLAEPAAPAWMEAYLRVRGLEGRLYPDSVVVRLPDVPASDPLAAEWRVRADSADRLVAYLGRRRAALRVLDVGCGNGWLTARLATLAASTVTGLDVNEPELDQARRVFGDRPNLRFELADALTADPPTDLADVIVLASVVQYVPDLAAFVRRIAGWLAPAGEIHVLDSPLYRADEVDAAGARSQAHYAALGVPEIAPAYHHHVRSTLDPFAPDVLHEPDALGARCERRLLRRARSPFPWLRITGVGAR
jgi:2-polyprenyl-3-methyl-5-hydroxy-6-metoxy-1,4-benzoquinol methylase